MKILEQKRTTRDTCLCKSHWRFIGFCATYPHFATKYWCSVWATLMTWKIAVLVENIIGQFDHVRVDVQYKVSLVLN